MGGAGVRSGRSRAEPVPSRPQWLNEEKIVQRLIEQIHPSKDDNVSVGPLSSPCQVGCPYLTSACK